MLTNAIPYGDGFIITAYLADRLKKGVSVYEAH